MNRFIFFIVTLVIVSGSLFAEELQHFSSEALRERYISLIDELRCPQCQNQNLQDSDSPIAKDLRVIVLKKLEEGSTDKEITDYLIDRYGDFITYMPQFKASTYGLWLTPAILLLIALSLVVIIFRRQRAVLGATDLSTDEQHKLAQMLENNNVKK